MIKWENNITRADYFRKKQVIPTFIVEKCNICSVDRRCGSVFCMLASGVKFCFVLRSFSCRQLLYFFCHCLMHQSFVSNFVFVLFFIPNIHSPVLYSSVHFIFTLPASSADFSIFRTLNKRNEVKELNYWKQLKQNRWIEKMHTSSWPGLWHEHMHTHKHTEAF